MDIVSKASATARSGASGATSVAANALEAAEQYQSLRGAIGELPEGRLKGALLTLVDAAGRDVSRARENIEDWFNSAMDRVSGAYKRRTHVIILLMGFGVTVFINADTVAIVNSLVQDKALRESLVAASQEYAKTRQQDTQSSPEQRVDENLKKIGTLGLPIGWNRADARTWPGDSFGGWLLKLFGWVLTAMAISLGAPFWFDMLNKVIVVRATVKPTEKSPDEPPVDRGPAPAARR